MARIDRVLLILSALALVNCGKGSGSGVSLDKGWSSKDIGAVGSPGDFSTSGGRYDVAGSDNDI